MDYCKGEVVRHFGFVAFTLLATTAIAVSPAASLQEGSLERSSSTQELIQRGNDLADNGHYDEAIKAFTLALQRDPGNGAALAGRSIAYAWTNRLEDAVRDVDDAERSIGDSTVVHSARGLIAMRRSDNRAAIAEFTAALAKDPADKWSLYFRASLYQQAHKDVAALADVDTFVVAHPRAAEGYVLRGRILIGQQKFTTALLDADRLVRIFPNEAKTLLAAADIYDGAGNRERALQAIDRAIALEPNSYLYRFMRSEYRRWDDFAGRRADLNAALQLDPGNVDAVTRLAQLDLKQHRWSDVIAEATTVLETDPKDYGVLAYRAMGYLNSNQPSLAQLDYDKALQFASGPNDLNNLCWAFVSEGYALNWALDACNRALASNPDQSRYLSNRALAELRLGHLDRALADYDHSITLNPREARAYYGRAVVLSRQGKTAAARENRQHALDLQPSIEDVFQGYGITDFASVSKPKP